MKASWNSLIRLGIPYIIVALIPVMSVFYLGNMLVKQYHTEIVVDKELNLEAAFNRFIQKKNTVEELSYILAMNETIRNYTTSCMNHSDHTVLDNLEIKELLNSMMVNSVIGDIYLYDRKDNMIISTNSALSVPTHYFKYAYVIKERTPEEKIGELEQVFVGNRYSTSFEVIMDNIEKEVMEFSTTLPIGMIRNIPCQLILVLEVEQLFGEFSDICGDGGEIYVYDKNDVLIYGSAEGRYEDFLDLNTTCELHELQNTGVYGMVLQNQESLWKIKLFIPNLMEQNDISAFSPRIWSLMAITIIFSIVFCVYFTHRNHKDIVKIMELFHRQDKEGEKQWKQNVIMDYDLIAKYVDKIMNENDYYKQSISELEISQKYVILDKLIRNTYKNEDDVLEELSKTDLRIEIDGKFVVLCIKYRSNGYRMFLDDNITMKDLLNCIFCQLIENQFELFDISARETICILSVREDENIDLVIENIISHLYVDFLYDYVMEVFICAGEVVGNIWELYKSYNQAKEVIRYNESSGRSINLYSELMKVEDLYYYPKDYDERIYNYVVVGQADKAKEYIQKLYEENFINNHSLLSVRSIEIIKNRLFDCVMSIAQKYDLNIENFYDDDRISEKPRTDEQNIQEYFDEIGMFVDILAEKINAQKKSTQHNSITQITSYVAEHYCDSTLSLKQISQHLGYHENYISNLFKQAYDEKISVYIEKLRIEKSKEQLEHSEKKIAEIAEMVGYTSDVSFRRAFKKMVGVSPTEYREIRKREENDSI